MVASSREITQKANASTSIERVSPVEWARTVNKVQYYGFEVALRATEALEGRDVKLKWMDGIKGVEEIPDPVERAKQLIVLWQMQQPLPDQYGVVPTVRLAVFSDLIIDALARTPITRTPNIARDDQTIFTREQQVYLFEQNLEAVTATMRACQLLQTTQDILKSSNLFPIHQYDLLAATAEILADAVVEINKERQVPVQEEKEQLDSVRNQLDVISKTLTTLPVSQDRGLITAEMYKSTLKVVTGGAAMSWQQVRELIGELQLQAASITGVDSATVQRAAKKKGFI